MSTPIIESIAADLLVAVNAITTGNGYNQTIVAKRPTEVDYQNEGWDDLSALIQQVNSDTDEGPMNIATRTQHFDVVVFAVNSDSSEVTIDTRLNQIFADVEKKLMADPTRSTYAIDTQIGDATFFKYPAGGVTGVAIDVAIKYRTVLTDPYTKA